MKLKTILLLTIFVILQTVSCSHYNLKPSTGKGQCIKNGEYYDCGSLNEIFRISDSLYIIHVLEDFATVEEVSITLSCRIYLYGNNHTITGGNYRALKLVTSLVHVNDLRFIDFNSRGSGGALYLSAIHQVCINNCIFINCSSNSYQGPNDTDAQYASGGAMHLNSYSLSEYILNNVTFINCKSISTHRGANSYGGAVYLDGRNCRNFAMSNCKYISCESISYYGTAAGGSFFAVAKNQVELASSEFHNSTCISHSEIHRQHIEFANYHEFLEPLDSIGAYGGAISISVSRKSTTLTLLNLLINNSLLISDGSSLGGAISLRNQDFSKYTFENLTIYDSKIYSFRSNANGAAIGIMASKSDGLNIHFYNISVDTYHAYSYCREDDYEPSAFAVFGGEVELTPMRSGTISILQRGMSQNFVSCAGASIQFNTNVLNEPTYFFRHNPGEAKYCVIRSYGSAIIDKASDFFVDIGEVHYRINGGVVPEKNFINNVYNNVGKPIRELSDDSVYDFNRNKSKKNDISNNNRTYTSTNIVNKDTDSSKNNNNNNSSNSDKNDSSKDNKIDDIESIVKTEDVEVKVKTEDIESNVKIDLNKQSVDINEKECLPCNCVPATKYFQGDNTNYIVKRVNLVCPFYERATNM